MKKIAIILMFCFICGTAWAFDVNLDFPGNTVTTTLSGNTLYFGDGTQIKSVTLKNGILEVIEVMPSTFSYPEGGSPPGAAIKYIYAAKDGKVYLKEKVEGKYYPSSFELKPESIEFGD